MLQQQHSEYDLCRRRLASTSLTLLAAFGQLLLDDEQQTVIFQGFVGVSHPGFPEILHRLGDEAIGEISGLRGIVWVKNADFEPETPLPIRPGKGPTATETLARMA